MDLASLQKSIADQGKHPPVEKWDPSFCGDIPMVIKQDGSWHYMGSPIGRQPLVQLFASIIKEEDGKYYLVTPVEKVGIEVQDVPFVVTEWRQQDQYILLTTSVGDELIVSPDNPVKLRFNQLHRDHLPYVRVRRNLWARFHQNVFYQLIELGEESVTDSGEKVLQLQSGGYRFNLGNLEPDDA